MPTPAADSRGRRRRARANGGAAKRVTLFVAIVAVLSLVAAMGWRVISSGSIEALNPFGHDAARTAAATGELNVGLVGDPAPTSLDLLGDGGAGTTAAGNPVDAAAVTAVEQAVLGNVVETLTTLDANDRPAPGLAQSWEVSPNGLTATLHLRQGVTFSNGHAVDAAAVMRSLQTVTQRKPAGVHAFANLTGVNAPDDHTVTLTFSKPCPDLFWQLAGRAGAVMDMQASQSTDVASGAIGSGPFTLAGFSAGQSITFKARADYWGAQSDADQSSAGIGTPARTGTITLRYYADENAVVNAMKSNEIQAASGLSKASGDTLTAAGGFAAAQGTGTGAVVLAFNGGTFGSLTSDRVMRQTIRATIDHDALIAARGGADTRLGGPISSLEPGYEDLTGALPAGDWNQSTFIGGTAYMFRLVYPARFGQAIGDTIVAQLQAKGIPAAAEMVDDATWRQRVLANHDFDMTIMALPDARGMGLYADPNQAWGYDSPDVQRLVADAATAADASAAADLLRQAARTANTDSPIDWLWEPHPTTVWRTGGTGTGAANVTGMPTALTTLRLPLAGVSVN